MSCIFVKSFFHDCRRALGSILQTVLVLALHSVLHSLEDVGDGCFRSIGRSGAWLVDTRLDQDGVPLVFGLAGLIKLVGASDVGLGSLLIVSDMIMTGGKMPLTSPTK